VHHVEDGMPVGTLTPVNSEGAPGTIDALAFKVINADNKKKEITKNIYTLVCSNKQQRIV